MVLRTLVLLTLASIVCDSKYLIGNVQFKKKIMNSVMILYHFFPRVCPDILQYFLQPTGGLSFLLYYF